MGINQNVKKFKPVAHKGVKLPSTLIDNFHSHAICVLSEDAKILNSNITLENLTGYKQSDLMGKVCSILYSKSDDGKKNWRNQINSAKSQGFSNLESICIKKDKAKFWCSFSMNAVYGANGKVKYYILVMQDITERKINEQKKDEYIGIASHELRAPISSLSLYSELLADHLHLESDKKVNKMFQDMRSQIKRLTNLVDDLLVVNEIERDKLELNMVNFDVNKFIRKIVRDFQATTIGHKIVFRGMAKGQVYGDQNRLTQVMINLIANGIKYSPLLEKVIVSTSSNRNKVIISVQDFGPGISSKERKSIFRRYFRAYSLNKGNMPGLGLGLYISKEIINNHNEKIWVKSRLGKGSTFFFSLTKAKMY